MNHFDQMKANSKHFNILIIKVNIDIFGLSKLQEETVHQIYVIIGYNQFNTVHQVWLLGSLLLSWVNFNPSMDK